MKFSMNKNMNTNANLWILLVLLPVLCVGLCSAVTIKVALDGSQPYSIIQEAVNASAHGDTVLVYPGRYIENVDYVGKNITIASLELTTGNPAYRDSTIIDGNQSGSVIKSVTPISNAGIYGFTLTNGSGSADMYYQGIPITLGGGIWLKDASSFHINNCSIFGNNAYYGGGIRLRSSTAYISNTTVRHNFATDGGGVYLAGQSSVIFDQTNRCSIYENTSGGIQDIVATDSRLYSDIYLDIGTVCPSTNYYIYYRISSPDEPGGFPIIDIQRGYRTEVNQDLFVSPSGNDANDGLSITTPLKNIYRAMQMVASDSLNPKIVNLAEGVYSSNEGQFFPIALKPYVKILGNVDSIPLLENLNSRETLSGSRAQNASIENITIDYGDNNEGAVAIILTLSENTTLKNIDILPHQSNTWKGIGIASNSYYPVGSFLDTIRIEGQSSRYTSGLMLHTVDAVVKGLTIDNCHTTGDEFDNPYPPFYFHGNKLTLENSQITNSSMVYDDPAIVSIGMSHRDSSSRLIMNNVLVANNQSGGESPVYIAAFTDSTSLISNCTFANNSGGNFAATLKGNIQVSNCIFDNDTPAEILIENTQPNFTSVIDFNNNFIRGYPQSFSSVVANEVSFNDVVLTGDPGFCSYVANDPMSYRLGNSSICRDVGTADTTGLFLPEYDLYGNQRVYGTAIDLGCNEWSYPVSIEDSLLPSPVVITTYPNPFTDMVNIRYNLSKAAKVNLQIYNFKGQLVKTLINHNQSKGEQLSVWEGCDDSSRHLASGLYFLRIEIDGKQHQTRKLVLLK
ncbi:MAG: DUF1565 domain-containing protein [Candidatus Cloacimonetes bacterium]|nr:DUF1565 domain-containing protein [Candidatus Cloacimonadota bacterium]